MLNNKRLLNLFSFTSYINPNKSNLRVFYYKYFIFCLHFFFFSVLINFDNTKSLIKFPSFLRATLHLNAILNLIQPVKRSTNLFFVVIITYFDFITEKNLLFPVSHSGQKSLNLLITTEKTHI